MMSGADAIAYMAIAILILSIRAVFLAVERDSQKDVWPDVG